MPRRVVDLTGNAWRLGQAPSGSVPGQAAWDELGQIHEWLPASVPGNVRADLIQAGRLRDLAYGRDSEAAQWVDDRCWWLAREFALEPAPGERVHLILRGVDYISDLFLNGRHLGRHEGMFSPQVHDVTDILCAENRLAVRLVGSRWLPTSRSTFPEKLLNLVESRFNNMPARFPHRRDTLKCQMGFGWDFAPPVRTMGIWDKVYAIVSGGIFIREIAAWPRVEGTAAILAVRVRLNAREGGSAQLRFRLSGETFSEELEPLEQSVELVPGANYCHVELTIAKPHLWWPWDHGYPHLYRLTVKVRDGTRVLDSSTQTLGLREVELEGWTVRVNGHRVYARGANWVPADLLPGRVTGDDYHALLTLARQANMNMLRVWGGGLREKRHFYGICDRLGILVWQEFPFACTYLTRHPSSTDYLQLVEAETRAIVHDLRNHPCIVLWCGGNEFSPQRNPKLVTALRTVVAQEDPGRPFLPASPSDAESHNWQVWHRFHPPSAYRRDMGLFASEFGLQAPPAPETLSRFIPKDDLWPPGPAWTHHGAGLQKLRRYAQPFLAGGETHIESFVQASQRAQVHGLQTAIEHYRRRKGEGCGGVLIWQFNEPWPAISWAIIDFYRQPKPAYEAIKRLFNPVLISAEYPLQRFQAGDSFPVKVWIINDRAQALLGCRMEVVLWDKAGQPVQHLVRVVNVAGDSSEIVGYLHCTLPTGGGWHLTCQLTHEGQLLATNEYDLTIHDGIEPALRKRLRTWLARLVTPD